MGDLGLALGYKTSDTETGEPRGSKGSPRLSNLQNKALFINYKIGLPWQKIRSGIPVNLLYFAISYLFAKAINVETMHSQITTIIQPRYHWP